MLASRALPLRRSLCRVARRQYGGGRRPDGLPEPGVAADAEPSNWPVLAGGVLACSLVAAGLAARSDWLVKRVQTYVDAPGADGASIVQIGGLMAAFTMAQLPADDLKLRLLQAGAARSWGRLVASFEADVQQVRRPGGGLPLLRSHPPPPAPPLFLPKTAFLRASADGSCATKPQKQILSRQCLPPRGLTPAPRLLPPSLHVALGALTALVDGPTPLPVSHASPDLYRTYVQQPLYEARSHPALDGCQHTATAVLLERAYSLC
jgi:hypothetical protein